MAKPNHIAQLKKGTAIWNEWREKNPHMIEAELTKPR
jgi:hypothetical protein